MADALGRYLNQRGVDPALAVEAGLLSERDSGGYRDRFRNRLLFPIRTREGRVVGFGGRALGDAMPKYLNSPQSAIFDKSALLYGLDLAQEAIRRADQVVIVEGYMDAIAAHQFGHANVVAAMGTAVTEQQIGLVKRLSRNIVLALDADAAGQGATVRSLEMLPGALDQELTPIGAERDASRPRAETMIVWQRRFKSQISIVRLPEGKDPDELIRRDPDPGRPSSPAPSRSSTSTSTPRSPRIDLADAPAKVGGGAPARAAPRSRRRSGRAGALRRDHRPQAAASGEQRLAGAAPQRGAQHRAALLPRRAAGHGDARASNENHLLALLLRHRAICQHVLPLVPMEDLADARNRELLRVLQDPEIPLNMAPEMIVAGLDDAVADHAEALLERLEQTPRAVSRADRARRPARPDPAREGALRLSDEPVAEQHRGRRGGGRCWRR